MSLVPNFMNDPTKSGLRRFLLFGGAAFVIALVWGVSRWASAPVYVTLYKDLEFKEVAHLEESLKRVDIPHRLAAGGTEVLVPVSEVARARVALAKDGLAIGVRPGMELFDKPSWGMTDFAQRVTFQRALEGELARTIGAIKGVGNVQVHLALPAQSAFRRDERKASASVVLELTGGTVLAPETIHGIVYIVSNSVEDLPADNVAVMDDGGRVLTAPAGPDGTAGTNLRQLEMQRATETALVAKIQNLLEPILGAGKVKAEVTADLSFDKIDRAVESLEPYDDTSSGDETAADDAAESGGADAGAVDESPKKYNARAVERREGAIGKLSRLTAAVLIEDKVLGASPDSATRAARLDEFRSMVRDAIGIDEGRGDRLSVIAVPFQPVTPAEVAKEEPAPKTGPDLIGTAEKFIRPLVGLLALIVLLVLAFRVLRIPVASSYPAPLLAAGSPSATNGTAGAHGPEAPAAAAPPNPNDPDRSLRVVRGWLKNQ